MVWPCQARQLRAELGVSPGRSWHRAAGGLEAGEGRVPGAAGDGGEGLAGLEVKGARVESQVGRVGKVWKRVLVSDLWTVENVVIVVGVKWVQMCGEPPGVQCSSQWCGHHQWEWWHHCRHCPLTFAAFLQNFLGCRVVWPTPQGSVV